MLFVVTVDERKLNVHCKSFDIKHHLLHTDPQLLHAFELFKEGHTDKDIERICKISARTFRRYRQRAGITREKYPAK